MANGRAGSGPFERRPVRYSIRYSKPHPNTSRIFHVNSQSSAVDYPVFDFSVPAVLLNWNSLAFNPADGIFYGTTQYGGQYGSGSIFSFDPQTNTVQTVYSFGNTYFNCCAGLFRFRFNPQTLYLIQAMTALRFQQCSVRNNTLET